MKPTFLTKNRADRRFNSRFKKSGKKSYFVLPNELFDLYKTREINAVDVKVFAYLSSLRREFSGVKVTQKRIAQNCGITEKTVSASTSRLYRGIY